MKVGEAIAEIMKREGIEILCGYPVNHLIEYRGGGRHPADHRAPGAHRPAHGRRDLARDVGRARSAPSACSTGRAPRTPMAASPRRSANRSRCWSCPAAIRAASRRSAPNYSATREMRGIAKIAEPVTCRPRSRTSCAAPSASAQRPRRAGDRRNPDRYLERGDRRARLHAGGRSTRYGPDPAEVRKAARRPGQAKRPVIYAGQGVHWAQAWPQLQGSSPNCSARRSPPASAARALPREPPLSLGSGGDAVPKPVHHFVDNADLIIGIGCSFTETNFGIKFPKGKK